jgi:hypothetical protein
MRSKGAGETMTTNHTCDDMKLIGLIVRYHFNDLRPASIKKIEKHLAECERCQGRLQAMHATFPKKPKDESQE